MLEAGPDHTASSFRTEPGSVQQLCPSRRKGLTRVFTSAYCGDQCSNNSRLLFPDFRVDFEPCEYVSGGVLIVSAPRRGDSGLCKVCAVV
mmetsp:Transcript_44389/g.117324  ORF Transcript_44389/g.117324 Transcript_44389/m.117324 type:complete len:90 (+) Transcript_44389:350-619(+)